MSPKGLFAPDRAAGICEVHITVALPASKYDTSHLTLGAARCDPELPQFPSEDNVSKVEEYHSHNTHRLDVEGTKELLLKLDFIRKDILGE